MPLEKQAKSESEPRDAWKSVSMNEVIEETAAYCDLDEQDSTGFRCPAAERDSAAHLCRR